MGWGYCYIPSEIISGFVEDEDGEENDVTIFALVSVGVIDDVGMIVKEPNNPCSQVPKPFPSSVSSIGTVSVLSLLLGTKK